jgi:hypothetical protein
MAKTSPIHNVFEGEFSPLSEGRVDIDRYPRAMRYMLNMVPCRTGPAIGRSGTFFERKCIEPAYASKLLPFEFNEDETLQLEFGHYLLRFHYEYNTIAAYREAAINYITGTNPFAFYAPTNNFAIGEHIVFAGLAPQLNMNGEIVRVTAVSGGVVTTDGIAGTDTFVWGGSPTAAVVYEIATPYRRNDVQNLRLVQELNVCYLFCTKTDGSGDYMPYHLNRLSTFNWTLQPFPLQDGPYMDINQTTTYLIPNGNGTWIPNMTSNIAPAPFVAAASSEVVGHEAFRAFDSDIDTYWEGNASQEGWLEFAFENGFTNSLPTFSGPTFGSMVISASTEASGHAAWKASDASAATYWQSTGNLPQSWYIDLGAAQTVREYALRSPKPAEWYAPKNFTLAGSNTGTSGPWATVDTRVGIQWDSGQRRQFTVKTPGAYRYYRINVTAVNNVYTVVKHPAVGTKGKKGYVAAYTTTTVSPNVTAFTQMQLSYGSGTPKCVDGYTIYLGRYNKGQDVINHAPKTWYFEGFDGVNYQLLDSQQGYEAWGNFRSKYFPLKNREAYKKYRIRIKTVVQAGDVNPRIGKLVMSSPDAPLLRLTPTSKNGINNGQGFLPTDVGRMIRVRDADNIWRWTYITAVSTVDQIYLSMRSTDPFVLNSQVKFWRLGLWSNTTGWPICGVLHEDRLFCAGANGFPDHVVGSYSGNHMFFQQVNNVDEVLDAHAIVMRCNSRFMSRIVWLKSAIEALRVGTGKNEFVISTPTDGALTASNVKARITTQRGSYPHESIFVDNEVVFLQESGRAIYNLSFSLTATGVQIYKSTLMSKYGPHLLQPPVVQIVYQQEPHSVIWGRRSDGSVVAMTYSTDDDIYGGHRHDFGANIKDMSTLYSPTDKQHALWMVAMRHVNGQDVHYIERLYRFWDFGDVLWEDATYVDSALRYYGTTPIDKVYGLNHLEGMYLNVLADGITYLGLGPVTHGMLALLRPATYIVAGLPMITQGEIIAPESGAGDGGTAQGKSKRPHSVVLRLWQSAGGEVGRWDEDHGEIMWTPCEYNYPLTANIDDITLRDCLTNVTVLPGGYGTLGTVTFRQTQPLPFNVAGVYPQTYVEDER